MRPGFNITGLVGFLLASAAVLAGTSTIRAEVFSVPAAGETDPVPGSGDAADDAAIWIHPTEPALSVIIGTDKTGGIVVYDLAGNEIQYLPHGDMNNADVRYDFPLGGELVDLVAVSDRSADTIALYKVNPGSRTLESVVAGTIPLALGEPYGLCMYKNITTAQYYVFVNDKSGNVEQHLLHDNGAGKVDTTLVRAFDVGSQTEGMVADDELGYLYVGEENHGIWKYQAAATGGTARTLVDTTGSGGHLDADVEGLTIYFAGDGTGYLIASSQGDDTFAVYRREGANEYVMSFEIVSAGGVDGTTDTDGIYVTNVALGAAFSSGLFVAQDGSNTGGRQNFKLVRWEDIAGAGTTALTIDTSWNPRTPGQPPILGDANQDGAVDDADLAIWLTNYRTTGVVPFSSGGWAVGNFNEDDTVDGADYTLWADNYTGTKHGAVSVPAPIGMWLLAAAGVLLGRRAGRGLPARVCETYP